MKAWRPLWPGLMIVDQHVGAGVTKSGLYAEAGLGDRDQTLKTKMVGEVKATFACKDVRPGDRVLFRYGMDTQLMDSTGEVLTFVHENHVIVVREGDHAVL